MKQHPATTAPSESDARPVRYISDRDVARRYGISRACVWRWAAGGVIPKPVRLAANTSRWDARELDRLDIERGASRLPTFRDLDALGTGAAAYLDACIAEVERGIPMAASKADRDGLIDHLHRLNRLHRDYFGEVAA